MNDPMESKAFASSAAPAAKAAAGAADSGVGARARAVVRAKAHVATYACLERLLEVGDKFRGEGSRSLPL